MHLENDAITGSVLVTKLVRFTFFFRMSKLQKMQLSFMLCEYISPTEYVFFSQFVRPLLAWHAHLTGS